MIEHNGSDQIALNTRESKAENILIYTGQTRQTQNPKTFKNGMGL